ncbi:hypothetical protein EPN42_10970 [bacterium]|nr:MAG: hypothetical protein EPN42_10970 [bacterium]
MGQTNGATKEQQLPEVVPISTAGGRPASIGLAFVDAIRPQNFEQAMYLCKMLAGSDFAPKDYKGKPANVLIAITEGAQVGLSPAQSLQGIAVINGRPSIWGDHALALVQAHPSFVDCKEWFEGEGEKRVAYCTLTRKGRTPVTRSFTYAQAKKARLIGKEGPWALYEERMHQMRARSWTLRDGASDILRGLAIAEEVRDYAVAEQATVVATGASGRLAARAEALRPAAPEDDPPTGQDAYISTLGAMIEEQGATVAAEHGATAASAQGDDAAAGAAAERADDAAAAAQDAPEPKAQQPAWRSAAERGVKAASIPWKRSVVTLGEEKGLESPEALLAYVREVIHADVTTIDDLAEDEIKAVHGALLALKGHKKRS